MKAVTVISNASGVEIERIETEYADAAAAKGDAVAKLVANEDATKVVVHEDCRPEPGEGEKPVPNVHNPSWFTPRIIYQKNHVNGDPELIGESWP